MLRLLLDTDVCIRAMKRRDQQLLQRLKANHGQMAISDVSMFELAYGAEGYANRLERMDSIEEFASKFEVLPFDTRAAFHAGNIRSVLEKRGEMIGAYDCLIAGIARSRGLMLVTRNTREFSRIAGLAIEDWLEASE